MLVLTRNPMGKLLIGNDIALVILGVQGSRFRLGIKTPGSVGILRQSERKTKGAILKKRLESGPMNRTWTNGYQDPFESWIDPAESKKKPAIAGG